MTNVPSPNSVQESERHSKEVTMRVRIRSLEIPPVKDGLVIGNRAAIGVDAMVRTLQIMTHETFERLSLNDELIEDVIIKTSILRKVGRERVVRFIMKNLKPVMTATELLGLDIHVELILEDLA